MTYRQDEVVKLADEMVFVKVNADVDTALANKYGVAGFPTIILTRPDGTEIDRIYGYAEGAEFVQTIRDYQADRNTLADYLRRADTAATDQLHYMIAEKYAGRKKYVEAETYYRKILQADPTNQGGYADSALFALGYMKSREKKYDIAGEIFRRFLNTYPDSKLAEEVAFQIANTLRRAEKYDEAVAEFRKFIEKYPESEMINDAEIYIAYVYDQKGDKETALALYRKFLERHPDSSDSSWVNEKIDKIVNPPSEEEKK